jgi:DNA repair exonuclease SbcCD nuclease subunit
MRILHLADVHLDTSFAGRSADVRARLREATRTALRRAVDLALRERVHVVLLAGDLFDGERISFETEQLLISQLERLSEVDIPVVYCTGNHDPGSGRRARRDIAWPPGVTVVDGPAPQRIPIPAPGDGAGPVGWVTTAGHASAAETRDLAADFPVASGELPEVAMLHTQVVDSRASESHEPYAPCELETLLRSGYDYWALGHVHLRQELSSHPAVHYPGNVQGRTPRETGPKGCILATVHRGAPAECTFHPLAPVRWEVLGMGGIEDVGTVEGLIEAVSAAWEDDRRQDPDPGAEWMVRVVLSGATPLAGELQEGENLAWLGEELTARLGALEVEVRTGDIFLPVDLESHLERDDVLGESLRLIQSLASHGGEAGGEELPAGIADELAGLGRDGDPALYLREILGGAEMELVSRILRREERG